MKKNTNADRVVFIDRDGVINWDPIGNYIKRWKDFKFLPHVMSSLKKLSDLDYKIIIISNQAGIGDKQYPEHELKTITLNMLSAFERKKINIHAVHYCLHGKKEGCECRKPEIKLFKQASKSLKYLKKKTYYIGDKATDMEAAKNFGLKRILVLTGHGKNDGKLLNRKNQPTKTVPGIKEAAEAIIVKT